MHRGLSASSDLTVGVNVTYTSCSVRQTCKNTRSGLSLKIDIIFRYYIRANTSLSMFSSHLISVYSSIDPYCFRGKL